MEVKVVKTTSRWTKADIELLRKYYTEGGSALCIERGLNKTDRQIKRRVQLMGLKQNKK